MPRAKLSNVSLKQLVAELDRRKSRLADLIAQRATIEMEIKELQSIPGAEPAPAKAAPTLKAKGRRRKRRKFAQTSEQFVLGLVKDKGATTAEIKIAWKDAGRGGPASPTLSNLYKAKKLSRKPLKGKKGFLYTST